MRRRTRTFLFLLAAATASIALAASTASPSDGWLGIRLRPAADGGVEIVRIVLDSPAADSGLRARDVIVAVDGEPISGARDLIRVIRARGAGAWVPLSVRRGDDDLDLRVRLASRPAHAEGQAMRHGWIGARAIDLPRSLREHFGAPADAGAMVFRVDESSPAESAGLRLGDVVYEVGGEPVGSARELQSLLAGAGVGNVVELGVARDGAVIVLEAPVEEMPPEILRERRPARGR